MDGSDEEQRSREAIFYGAKLSSYIVLCVTIRTYCMLVVKSSRQ
jgi:hypothetical protein